MNTTVDNTPIAPRWLTWWAWLTVAAVLPLLFLGALVTTMKVGMADQRSVVSPLEAMVEMSGDEQSLGWKIEHAHRLAGWFAGMCGIVLAIGFWFGENGAKYRCLGLAGVTLIASQGLLGIFRVQLNSLWGTDLAWIHGIFAQIVFASLACIAVMASPSRRISRLSPQERTFFRGSKDDFAAERTAERCSERSHAERGNEALRTWSLVCVGLVLGQLVLGGVIRHQPSLLMARLHILGAFVVLAGLLWLAKLSHSLDGFRPLGWVLLGLVGLEIVLGVETGVHWMARFFRPDLAASETYGRMLTRTVHYVVGSLLFAATAIVALKAHRGMFALVRTIKPAVDDVPALAGQSLQGGVA